MERRDERRAALAVMGAVAGTGYASGRELTLFFAQLGWACWVGIALAALAFGGMVAVVARWMAGGGGSGRWTGGGLGRLIRLLRALLLALTAAGMLCCARRMGELTLPMRHGFLWGAGLAVLIAGLVNLAGLGALRALGLVALAGGMLFHAALALDPRPVRTWLMGEIDLALEGSVPAAALLALCHVALNASVAAGVAARCSGGCLRPARLGLRCGALMLGALMCANAALARGGRALLAQAMPFVLLSARWGVTGFWLCAAFNYLCAVCTLAATSFTLRSQLL